MAAAVVLASACVPAAAHAATIHVNTDKDPEAPAPGVCSLREAIIASNTDVAVGGCPAGTSGGNTIELPGGTYVLTIAPTGVDDATTGDLNITAPVKISGAGLATTAIVQTRADRVIDDESAGVQISGVTIRGGYLTTTGDGGAILIGTHAALTLASSELNSDSAAEGGGVFIDPGGKAAIESTTISADRAIYTGGGIVNEGTLTLSGGEVGGTGFASNQAVTGAGITSSGLLTVTGTTIMGNLSQSWGGGLFLSGPTTLTNVQVSDNSSEAEGGGGIAFFSEGSYELDIEGSTIGPNNTALRGGDGVFLGNESIGGFPTIAKLTRSTIAENGNLGSKHGGGLFLEPHTEATLHDVTLAENSAGTMNGDGGNLYAEAESKLRWENSLVANAATGGNCAVPNGSTTSLGGNQEYGDAGDANPTTGCGFTNAAQGDVQLGSDLEPSQLLPLASNGGPTETMALAPGSPPVNTGFGCEPTDQRGVPRPQGSGCDAGAYELVGTPLVVTITSGPSGTVTTPDVSFSFSAEEPSTFQCKLDGGAFEPCTSPFNAGPLALGQHTFSVQATDPADNMGPVTASRTFMIVAAGSGGGGGGGGSALTPLVSSLTQSAAKWREGNALAQVSATMKGKKKTLPVGTTFSFSLNEPASVTFAFTQAAGGRKVGQTCVAQTKKNKKERRCTRKVLAGTLTFSAHAGTNKVHFEGRISNKKKLKPGRYTLLVTATASGEHSTPGTLHFAITKG